MPNAGVRNWYRRHTKVPGILLIDKGQWWACRMPRWELWLAFSLELDFGTSLGNMYGIELGARLGNVDNNGLGASTWNFSWRK